MASMINQICSLYLETKSFLKIGHLYYNYRALTQPALYSPSRPSIQLPPIVFVVEIGSRYVALARLELTIDQAGSNPLLPTSRVLGLKAYIICLAQSFIFLFLCFLSKDIWVLILSFSSHLYLTAENMLYSK